MEPTLRKSEKDQKQLRYMFEATEVDIKAKNAVTQTSFAYTYKIVLFNREG